MADKVARPPHPELQEGEVFQGNVYNGDSGDEKIPRWPQEKERDSEGGFDSIGWKTKRQGNIAYNRDGQILPTHRPVFVQRSEIVAAGYDPDQLFDF
jgi:hypothetical protein